jgi:hypothetical protein
LVGVLIVAAAAPAGSSRLAVNDYRPLYLLGRWDTLAVTSDGVKYPQTWKITSEDFRYTSDGGGGFSGTDAGFKLVGKSVRTAQTNTLENISVAGDYKSVGKARLTETVDHFWVTAIKMSGSFRDSNGTRGTFTGTLVDPRPARPPSSGKLTVGFGGKSGKSYASIEYYVKRGTLLRVCNNSTIIQSPYALSFPLSGSVFYLQPGDCTKYVSVGNRSGLTLLFDSDHPNAYAYIDIAR